MDSFVASFDASGTGDAYGDPTISYTTSTVLAHLDTLMRNDKWVTQGQLEDGDAIGYFKSATTIALRDRVIFDTVTYEVATIEEMRVQGKNIGHKVALKRVGS